MPSSSMEPIDALYRHFHVAKVGYHRGPVEDRFDLILTTIHAARYPSHCLAVTQTNAPPGTPTLMLPVCKDLYKRGFNPDIPWPREDEPPDTLDETGDVSDPPPQITHPLISGDDRIRYSIPVFHISIPHLVSLPLVLLFGLGLETDVDSLSYHLLPASVVAEFPARPAMAEVFAKFSEQQFERYYHYIKGFWENSVALGVRDRRIADLVSTSWKVASDARRIRRHQQQR